MKRTIIKVISCTILATLVACKPKTGETPPASGPIDSPMAAVAPLPAVTPPGAVEFDEFAPCLQAAAKTKTVDASEAGLREVQFLMTCSENYLAAKPGGEHGADALRLWYKGVVASNDILQSIQRQESAETQDPAEAQRRLIGRENIQRLARENGYIINRAFQYYTIQTLLKLYEELKASGVRMESAIPWLNEANLSRRRTGVWELAMDGSYDDGNFVVVRDFGRKDPYFNVAGFGVFGPNVILSDSEQIDAMGWYGPACKVKVTTEDKQYTYGCDAYLSGQVIEQMRKDMRKALDDSMVRKEKMRAAHSGG